ncbi:unnamed protein product [Leptosia nina]|uniref:Uncharacterized protein n=1 Tax=Leptosia nina TaxID=320188 RepID=A0AAV1JKT7_9NEOP
MIMIGNFNKSSLVQYKRRILITKLGANSLEHEMSTAHRWDGACVDSCHACVLVTSREVSESRVSRAGNTRQAAASPRLDA